MDRLRTPPPSMATDGWLALDPLSWRDDLLRILLRVTLVLGGIVCVPSAWLAIRGGVPAIAVLDCAAVGLIAALAFLKGIPNTPRAACTCLVFFALGVGLLIGIGPICMIYLFGFSILTTLLLSFRWGLASVVLNAGSLLGIGVAGIATPMAAPQWSSSDVAGWTLITANFAMVNACLVLALGAVIAALERALERSLASRAALEQEGRERAKVTEALQRSRELLAIAARTVHLGGWQVAVNAPYVEWSDEVCRLHEVPEGSQPTLADGVAFYAPEYRDGVQDVVTRCMRDGTPFDVEAEIVTARGARRWVRAIGNPLWSGGAITHVHGSVQDITERKLAQASHDRLAEQLRQAQKLETVGSLAGGVAHDFNNLMSVVLTYSEMLADQLRADDPMRADLIEIRNAGQRAADLTRQLLAFSRQQVLEPKIIDLSATVGGMEKMLRRLLGEDIELATTCAAGLGKVLVDPSQMEQVIMNLAVNARDAMPRGGMLTIETSAVVLDEHYVSEHVGMHAGPHVMLAVSDTGTGMSKATQARMFEPFFTTKEQGRGTGLGLATVFGIVRQSGGSIFAYSELGKGTTFKVYFPIAERVPDASAPARPSDEATPSTETILLVEDDDTVRSLACTILRKRGYTVLDAQNGGEAFLMAEQHIGPIHLLLTDVVMPRMSGRQLAERVSLIRPELKVLYMSGYTDDAIVRHGILSATLSFLQKPITPEPLLRKVREVLDARASPTDHESHFDQQQA